MLHSNTNATKLGGIRNSTFLSVWQRLLFWMDSFHTWQIITSKGIACNDFRSWPISPPLHSHHFSIKLLQCGTSHNIDVIMTTVASQITSLTAVYSAVYSQIKYRGPVNSPHKGPVTPKMFLFDDVIMCAHSTVPTVLNVFFPCWYFLERMYQ